MTDAEANIVAKDGRAQYRIFWVPQIPMEAFYQVVEGYDAGVVLCDILGKYDAFQFEHSVKPDYCNAGGVEWLHPELTGNEWCSLDQDEAEYLGLTETRS